MARPKQKGKGKAFGAKKTVEQKKEKKINPFDLIFKKKTGNEANVFHSSKGHSVAASRKKGMENRQKTIGIEYKQFSRVNKFLDCGQASCTERLQLDIRTKAEKRFVLQRKKLFSANNRFNLDSNHQEEQLADFPTNNPVEEDQDVQSDDAGELGPDLVAMANFGGGSFGDPLDGLDKDSRPKRRDVLANLIALSKQSKTMRKMEKDVQLDKTDDLNELFVKLQGSGMLSTSRSNNALKSSDTDDYDTIYRELQFDNRTKELNAENQQAQPQPTAAGVSQAQQFADLLKEYMGCAESPTSDNISTLGVLIPKMHALTKKKPVECSHQVLQLLVDVRQQKLDTPSSCLGVSFPVLALVQLVCDLYGTANWAIHPVATPTLVFAMQVLSSTKIKSVLHCSQAMLFMAVMAKWAEHSNRYQPEGIAFLHDAFLLCVEESVAKQFPSKFFSTCEPQNQLLFLNKKSKMSTIPPLSMSNAFIAQQDDESVLLKMQTIRILIAVTLKYTQLYSLYRQSSYAIFRPILNAVNSLPVENYPSCLAADLDNLKAALDSACESKALTQMKVQPRRQEKTRQITFLEPRVEEHFNPERPRKESGGKVGKAHILDKQMKQRLRKETRGAAKELRMDAKYIAKIQDERNSKVSRERKEKTNRIMQGLQSQESEYKKRTAKKF